MTARMRCSSWSGRIAVTPKPKVPDNIILMFLPRRSPELNPVEKPQVDGSGYASMMLP